MIAVNSATPIHGIRYNFEEFARQEFPRLIFNWCESTERYRDHKTQQLWTTWLAATLKNWSENV